MSSFDADWLLTPDRLAIHRPTRTAVLADWHLGYYDARRQSGDAVPMVSMEDQFAPLQTAREVHGFVNLVVAGDLCEARIDDTIVGPLLRLLAGCGLTLRAVVPGNHDRGWETMRDRLPIFPDGHDVGGWTVIHGDGPWPTGRSLMGHFHPAWRQGNRLLPCYLVGPGRMVLPAFSRDAAGGDVHHSPRWHGYQGFVIDGDRVINRGTLANERRQPRRGLRSRTPSSPRPPSSRR